HSILVNTKALEMAGIDAHTPTPRMGEMPRDEQGMPIGLFQELSATCLLLDSLKEADFSVEEYIEGIGKFQEEHAFPCGLVGIFDAY
ncbi:amidohydrolase family protein, partial [Pseudomonas aeruginosa]|nr:amidohydrolase family protein [Pseudomonas aeruginosa]